MYFPVGVILQPSANVTLPRLLPAITVADGPRVWTVARRRQRTGRTERDFVACQFIDRFFSPSKLTDTSGGNFQLRQQCRFSPQGSPPLRKPHYFYLAPGSQLSQRHQVGGRQKVIYEIVI